MVTDTKSQRDELEKVRSKIRKLFALGKSSNEYESALALKRAQELVDKYNLNVIELLAENVLIV